MVQNFWKKVTDNLGFVKISNCIRESTEAAVHGCSGTNSRETPVAESYFSKVAGLTSITLLQ